MLVPAGTGSPGLDLPRRGQLRNGEEGGVRAFVLPQAVFFSWSFTFCPSCLLAPLAVVQIFT